MRLSELFSLHLVSYLTMLIMSFPGTKPVTVQLPGKAACVKTEAKATVAQTDTEDLKSELLFKF